MIKVIAAVAAAALLSAVPAGCAGSSSGSGAITQAEYTKQAKAICHKGEQAKEEAIGKAMLRYQEGEKNATPKMQEEAVREVLVPYERTTQKLAALDAPEASQKQVEQMLRLREEAADQMKSDPEKALHNSGPIQKAISATEGLGLSTCDF